MFPVSLISVDKGTYSICIDKEQQRLHVFKGRDSVLELPCSTGMNPGNKQFEGDKRTPEGVYFFDKILDGKDLPDFYGWRAYTLNYPNPVDRSIGRNGNGIWIHGRIVPLDFTDTKGCVSLTNDDLKRLSAYLNARRTPVIILKDMVNIDRKSLEVMEQLYAGFVFSWIDAWENKDIEHFRGCYSNSFYDTLSGDTLSTYIDRKKGTFEKYDYITILTNGLRIVSADGYVLCYFLMDFSGGGFQSTGIKYVYLENSSSGPKILAEEFMPLSRAPLWDQEAGDLERREKDELNKFLDSWISAWKTKDFEGMRACYADSFPSLDEFFDMKKRNLEPYRYIQVRLDDIKTDRRGVFWNLRAVQEFTSDKYRDVGIKELQLIRTNKGFYIKQEKWERIHERS
ncbi:MAG: L,D-transpeptidase family protein [Deltaproteobacteria bacterium]|nr:L,D-transpeptidase family protein [Deltaproteobacteria bacterium]